MIALLLGLASASIAAEDWTILVPPAVCRSTPAAPQPAFLASGSHLELSRADMRFEPEARTPPLPFATFLQMIEEDARGRGARIEIQRQSTHALLRADAPALAAAHALEDALERAGLALDIDVEVELVPLAPDPDRTALSFRRRVRSGDMAFFGRREARAFVAGFDVEVAAHSGSAEPIRGRASSGRGLHLIACRVAGGERVFVWGCLDLADLVSIDDFDPGTADLGILQQPRLDWTQVVFAGVVDPEGSLEVEIGGARPAPGGWKLSLRATTTSDATLDAAAGEAGFALIDMALLASEPPALEACDAGTLLSNRPRNRPFAVETAPLPPSAVAALVESTRGSGGSLSRGTRAALYWSESLLCVPRSDPAAVRGARAYVRAAESARLAGGRVEIELGGARASLPTCAGIPARFATGSERTLLVGYRLEVAPETWMPAPIVEPAFDGVCFEIAPDARGASVSAWMSSSGPLTEITREGAVVGRLQMAARSLLGGNLRAAAEAPGRIELSGDGAAVVLAHFEPR